MRNTEYRKYDPVVKKLIIQTGNKELFPELNIPRNTIKYWLESSKTEVTTSTDNYYEIALKKLKEELYQEKAKNYLLNKCLTQVFNKADLVSNKSKENKKFIVDTVVDFQDIFSLKGSLKTIGVSAGKFYRWKTEVYGCQYNRLSKCQATRSNQLTYGEQELLIKYATDKKFKYYSTKSLMYYCLRKNIINCHISTWYKYLNMFGIKRTNQKLKQKNYKSGYRANSVNECWHVDITEIKYGKKNKAYLQVVVDNYSRMIVGWKLSQTKTAMLTIKTILKSLKYSPEFKGMLISDGGGENIAREVKNLFIGRGIKQFISKKQIKFSNSMVEVVFRQLKQKFIGHYVQGDFKTLYSQIRRFVSRYNTEIPHNSLGGATPKEVFNNSFDFNKFIKDVHLRKVESWELRKQEFCKCTKCVTQFGKELCLAS